MERMRVERNRDGNKYTFIPEDKEDEIFLDRIAQLEEENKRLKEKLSEVTMVADDEKQSIEHILELEKENKILREDNRFLTKISKEYMEKENIVQITEFTGLYKDDLEKENERLRKENEELQEYKSMYEGLC